LLIADCGKFDVKTPNERNKAMDIADWRQRIDAVDLKILELLNERARYSLEIGKIKQRLNLPVYMPERENHIYARLERANRGPLADAAVRCLFERIIEESRRMEAACKATALPNEAKQ
jgi:chorismate mutase-like protein